MARGSWIIFRIATVSCALDRTFVRRILPLPRLDQPPGLPAALEGVFDHGGTAVPVLGLDRLFGLAPSGRTLYRHLILCRAEPPLALLVDEVTQVAPLPGDRIAPLAAGETLNGCVTGRVVLAGTTVHVLDGDRILDRRERQVLEDFQASWQRRYDSLAGRP